MCLIVNRKLCPKGYKIAKKRIPCYKILLKRKDGLFETPMQRYLVPSTGHLIADKFQEEPHCNFPRYNAYVEHGIHSYTTLEKAKKTKAVLGYFGDKFIDGIVIKKAYIPKDTKYWVGEQHEFCSEKIVFARK